MKASKTIVRLRALVTGSLAILLAGCSANTAPVNVNEADALPLITLSQAREFENSILWELHSYVPGELLLDPSDTPFETMRAMSCNWSGGSRADSKKGVFLPGAFDFEASLEADMQAIFDAIDRDFNERPGWTAKWRESYQSPSLVLESEEGFRFHLHFLSEGRDHFRVLMGAYSPCLKAPDDFDIFSEY